MMKQIIKFYPTVFALASLLPLAAGAQGNLPGANSQLNSILSNIGGTLTVIIAFLFVFATVLFLWGIVMYVANAGDETKQKSGRKLMLWGIIGLAVMASVWGVVNILIQYFLSGDIGRIPEEPGQF